MKRLKDGFTLIELLVVISIILIVSSVIFVGGNSGAGAKLSSSQRIVSGLAQGARGQAILKNAKTRLIIYADTASNREDDKYLRYFGIIYEDNENPGQWKAATQGTSLPEGIYFDPQQSTQNGSSWSVTAKEQHQYPFAISKAAGTGQDYYYYEFNSNGTMATGFDNAWLVIRSNTLRPNSSGVLDVDFDTIDEQQKYIAGALIFRRAGTTTMVSDPEDIIN
jgi:prepilin-type N-terminal cleavage/methylation domain-containing protein